MKGLKSKWAAPAGALCGALVATTASAAITVSQTDYASAPSAFPVAGNGVDTTVNVNGTNTANFVVPVAPQLDADDTNNTLAQSFQPTIYGLLNDIEVIVQTDTPTTASSFNIGLYDAGSAGTTTPNQTPGTKGNTSPLSDDSASGYVINPLAVPGTASSETTSEGGQRTNVSANLLPSGGTPVTFSGYSDPAANYVVLDFSFSGADSILLSPTEEYVFEVRDTGNIGDLEFERNSAAATPPADYPYGQVYAGQDALANPAVDLAVAAAVTPVSVPEPMSAAMLGLVSGYGLLSRRRRRV